MSKSTSSSKGATPKSSGKPVGGIKKSSSKDGSHTKVSEGGKLTSSKLKLPKHGDLSERGEDKYFDEHYAKYDTYEKTPSHIKSWQDIKIKTLKKNK